MAVQFGFSIGDLIAGIKLIITCVKATQDGKGATTELQALTDELESLKIVLKAIDDLCLQEIAPEQYAAIDAAVHETRQYVEVFVKGIASYQQWLQPKIRGWKANLTKIKWVLCKREDLVNFKCQLERRKSSLTILLIALQVRQGEEVKQVLRVNEDIAQDSQAANMEVVNGLSRLHTELSRHHVLREQQLMKEITQLRCAISPQILFQKPVVLLDACGRIAPFHLEFITSTEAFISVLKARFKQCGITANGLSKLDRLEFAVCNRQRYLSLTRPWETIFEPGQYVDMSMIFHKPIPENTCPSCKRGNECQEDADVECFCCGLHYRRIVNLSNPPRTTVSEIESDSHHNSTPKNQTPTKAKSLVVDTLDEFRRVQVISSETSLEDTFIGVASTESLLSGRKPLKYTIGGAAM